MICLALTARYSLWAVSKCKSARQRIGRVGVVIDVTALPGQAFLKMKQIPGLLRLTTGNSGPEVIRERQVVRGLDSAGANLLLPITAPKLCTACGRAKTPAVHCEPMHVSAGELCARSSGGDIVTVGLARSCWRCHSTLPTAYSRPAVAEAVVSLAGVPLRAGG
jgi:hypothetical protein